MLLYHQNSVPEKWTCKNNLVNFWTEFINVNQLLCMRTFFLDLPVINWFATFHYQKALSISVLFLHSHSKDWFAVKNICNNEAAENLTNISCTQIKVGWSVYIVVTCAQKTNYCKGALEILEFIKINLDEMSIKFCWCINSNKMNRSCRATLLC